MKEKEQLKKQKASRLCSPCIYGLKLYWYSWILHRYRLRHQHNKICTVSAINVYKKEKPSSIVESVVPVQNGYLYGSKIWNVSKPGTKRKRIGGPNLCGWHVPEGKRGGDKERGSDGASQSTPDPSAKFVKEVSAHKPNGSQLPELINSVSVA